MPSLPLVVSGLIKNSNGVNEENALIVFTTSLGTILAKSNSKGQYLVDLTGVGYVADETVTYVVNDYNKLRGC